MTSKEVSFGSKAIVIILAGAMTFTGCAEMSRMSSSPEGGKIYVNGIYIGETPTVIYKYRAGLPDSYVVEVKKEGYKNLSNVTIDRSLRADISLLLLIAAIVPYFFSARLEDQYVFQLEAATPAAPAPAPAPAAPPAPAK